MPSYSRRFRTVAAAVVVAMLLLSTNSARSAEPAAEVRAALDDANRWLNATPNGATWQAFLRFDELEAQLAEPGKATPRALTRLIRLHTLGAPETNRPQFLRLRKALEAWLASLPPMTAEQLQAEIENAKASFEPRTESDVAAAKTRLVDALKRLGATLDPANAESNRWRMYLKWDELQSQLARQEGPDLAVLDNIYAQYAAGHDGLDLGVFQDVRVALRGYLNTSRAVGDATIKTQYEQLLDDLPEYLNDYRQNPTPDGAAALASAIQWLAEAGQVPWLVESIKRDFTQPNLFARIDADVVTAGLEGSVDETAPVTDVILGASVRGTGRTVGQVAAELVPNETRAEVVTIFKGTMNSTTVSYKSGASVSSSGVTQLETRKPIILTAEGYASLPATSSATTRSTIRGINSGRGRAGQQAATNEVYGQKGQAERVSSQHAEARANRRADEKANETLADAQKSYLTKFRDPLLTRNLFPKQFDFRTTKEAIFLTGLQVGPYDLGAPNSPPATIANPHLAMQVHESMVNNLAAGGLSGRILTEAQFLATLEQLLGEVPERFRSEEAHEPWTITFARDQPITVTFGDGEFRITIRGQRYATGETSYPGMDVTAVYKPAKGDAGLKAVRQGALEIFPPGFEPGGEARLSVREQTIRRMLERRFGTIFEEEMVPEPLVLPGKWENSGKYGLAQWDIADGWMVMSWNRIPGSETAAPSR